MENNLEKLKEFAEKCRVAFYLLWFSARTLFFYRITWSKNYVEN